MSDIPAEAAPAECCAGCRFFFKGISPTHGTCRRFPPIILAQTESTTVGEQGEYREEIRTSVDQRSPEMHAGEWCGEFRSQR